MGTLNPKPLNQASRLCSSFLVEVLQCPTLVWHSPRETCGLGVPHFSFFHTCVFLPDLVRPGRGFHRGDSCTRCEGTSFSGPDLWSLALRFCTCYSSSTTSRFSAPWCNVATGRKEASWHRRARKLRTAARHCLRTFVGGTAVSYRGVTSATRRLEAHHSASSLPRQARTILTDRMAYSNPWWCTGCSRWCKAKADFCGGCGAHWQQVSYAQPSTTRATTSPRRRARSPRQKPWGPQPAKGKGGGQPVAKGKGGKSEPPSDAAPPYAVAPWRPPSGQLASAELPRTDDSTVQELLGAIRSTMTQQGLPTQVEEAMAKLEQNTGRLVTKSIHSQTTAMGAARKQLQNIKESKRSQEASWVEFLNSTVTALEKGSQRFQETMADLDAKEIEAAKKLAAARKAIRALAGDKEPPETVGSADEDGDSDVELMEDTAVVDLPSGEDTKIMQAHKKLRVTLDSLLMKLPMSEDGTPRRRGRGSSALPSSGPAREDINPSWTTSFTHGCGGRVR